MFMVCNSVVSSIEVPVIFYSAADNHRIIRWQGVWGWTKAVFNQPRPLLVESKNLYGKIRAPTRCSFDAPAVAMIDEFRFDLSSRRYEWNWDGRGRGSSGHWRAGS